MLNKRLTSSTLTLPTNLVPQLKKGRIFIISAPAGTGKTSLVYQQLEWFSSLELSITYTTRKPRNNEKDGVDYHFISTEEFDERIRAGDFLEHIELHGNKYGSSRSNLEEILSRGKHVIMVIDTHGALAIRKILNPVMIFIKPPSMSVLKERMMKRGSETEESLERRLIVANQEMSFESEYDYSIINDDFTVASLHLSSIFIAEALKNK